MSETDPWREELQKRAEAVLAAFIETNPEYTVDADQPECRGNRSFITFGTFRGQPVVYKQFEYLSRKRQEEKALQLFASTGLVPKLYPAERDSLLVMERLGGLALGEAEVGLTQDQIEHAYYQIGRAVARIVEFAPGAKPGGREDLSAQEGTDYEYYRQAGIDALFDTVMERAAKILVEHDVPDAEVLKTSLTLLQQNRDAILSYPSFVQMDDFHPHNIIMDGSQLRGFIDFEMTRYGNEVFLLASAMVMTKVKPPRWAALREGYEDYRGKPIDSQTMSLAKIAAPFSQWIRFMWYWTTDPKFLEEGETTRLWPIRYITAVIQKLQETDS